MSTVDRELMILATSTQPHAQFVFMLDGDVNTVDTDHANILKQV